MENPKKMMLPMVDPKTKTKWRIFRSVQLVESWNLMRSRLLRAPKKCTTPAIWNAMHPSMTNRAYAHHCVILSLKALVVKSESESRIPTWDGSDDHVDVMRMTMRMVRMLMRMNVTINYH